MARWKTGLRGLVCGLYRHSGAMRLHETILQTLGQQFMTILLFHRVTDTIPEDGLTVSPDRFKRICKLLASRFRVVPLGDVFRICRAGLPMPPRTLAITFDDCYRDNLDAARVLANHGLPATFFLPTAYVGTARVFDWDRGLPPMPNLTWNEVGEMARLGFEIGSHTISHANLGAVNTEQAHHEIFDSRRILQDRLDRPIRWFAYPFGGQHHLRPEYIPLIRDAGYEGVVSAYGGFVKPGSDRFLLPREAVPYFHSMYHLEMHLSGCMHWLYTLRGREAPPQVQDPWLFREQSRPASRPSLKAVGSRQ